MKFKVILIVMLLVLIPLMVSAAAQKIGVIDVDKVYNDFEEKNIAEQQFYQESAQWEKDLGEKESEINRLKNEYENLPPIVSKERRSQKLKEIEQKETDFYNLANDYRNKAIERQMELLAPISEKIVNAINEVAEENNLDIVLNTMQGEVVLYIKNEDIDITEAVIEKLNINAIPAPEEETEE
ncbi:MAG: OmpH family outer membrane protein [Candidatus Cloacimonetes bacterium]|nr:OmpH family outer membrane protein [Candidatus Cloacimonadota bacterium]